MNSVSDTCKLSYFMIIKLLVCNSTAAGINIRTAQLWTKKLREDPAWDIYEKQTNKINRAPSQLKEEHKRHLVQFFDERPQATRQDAVDSLMEAFKGFNLKKTVVGEFILHDCNLTVKRISKHPKARNKPEMIEARYVWVTERLKTDMNYLQNCVFVDEAAFDINMRLQNGRSLSGTPVIVETETTRAITHTILGAISAKDVIGVEIREPFKPKLLKVAGAKKRKKVPAQNLLKGTCTGHYMRFISKIMDEMDKYSEMDNFYIVMDNSPIHTHKDIDKMIVRRGYRPLYLPKYSPELNPIEIFWATIKDSVKRSMFKEDEDLRTRITEASEKVTRKNLCNFAQHSVNNFQKCLDRKPL
ncbi:hypothetical protein INT46_000767 [Mucor plumbeus]|uniref:Tc1-like transposase DDE domain-containing protein n=1 Tax=Mucor plumbeus TaxID=97098 RepID=A0A8H7QIP6_9FUNG|nr:hypothetical protein INT46_000767 [Mucor plumbeus]